MTLQLAKTQKHTDTINRIAWHDVNRRWGLTKYGANLYSRNMDQKDMRPKVGIGVMIIKDGKVLLGKRKSSHGEGEYAFPGGHLEYMESFEDCVKRETKEECGIEVNNIRFQFLANFVKYAPKHYAHINILADWKSGEPKILEPEKCESWDWYDTDNLPKPLFAVIQLAIDVYKDKSKGNYFDIGDF